MSAQMTTRTSGQTTGRCGHSQLVYRNLRFLITDKPNDATLSAYICELKRQNVSDVVRVCDSTYASARLVENGIAAHEMTFADGTPPPAAVIKQWLSLVERRFVDEASEAFVAVHCVAGLGRAPVLVAIALIEAGMRYEEAVEAIRGVRRGAINARQLAYLSTYRRTSKRLNKAAANRRKLCLVT